MNLIDALHCVVRSSVGIKPDDTDFIGTFLVKGSESRNAADCDGMILVAIDTELHARLGSRTEMYFCRPSSHR